MTILRKLTKLPAINPTNPRQNKKIFLNISIFPYFEDLSSLQYVRLCIIGGAIRANVEELIEPTKLMNKSSLGMAAASATVI